MTIDDVIEDFATTGCTLPRGSMQWALDNWDEAAPGLITLLERYATGEDRSDRAGDAVFFAVHLVGQKAERCAFPALCRLMRDEEACEGALGAAITETLPQIIISTYDGDLDRLKSVIEDAAADAFVRHGALLAMAYLARTGRFPEDAMRGYLRYLQAEMQPRDESPVWVAWVRAVACLGYEEHAELAEELFRRGFIEPFAMSADDFRCDLQQTLADPSGMAGFECNRLGPFGEAIETLSRWYYFTDDYKRDQARRAAREAVDRKYGRSSDFPDYRALVPAPHINMLRDLGRNDPCPCGSGKKYKKCCLYDTSAFTAASAAE